MKSPKDLHQAIVAGRKLKSTPEADIEAIAIASERLPISLATWAVNTQWGGYNPLESRGLGRLVKRILKQPGGETSALVCACEILDRAHLVMWSSNRSILTLEQIANEWQSLGAGRKLPMEYWLEGLDLLATEEDTRIPCFELDGQRYYDFLHASAPRRARRMRAKYFGTLTADQLHCLVRADHYGI